MAKKKPTAKQLAARKKFARIMKSGGFKKKSAKKSGPKKTKTGIKKRISKTIRTRKMTRKPMARRRSVQKIRRSSKKVGMSLRRGLIGEVIKGVGGGSVVSLVMSRIAPQYAGIGSIAGGFLAGGMVGGAANLVISGGLGNITNLISPAQTSSQGVMSV